MKQLKRTMEETEDELSKEKMQRRKIQREVEDMLEAQEAQNREISSLKTKLRYGYSVVFMHPHMGVTNFFPFICSEFATFHR